MTAVGAEAPDVMLVLAIVSEGVGRLNDACCIVAGRC
jgi:hypothetical protein